MSEDLIERLRGTYRIPITDGMGPAGGEDPDNLNEFVRTFDTPPIQKEAADEIERLRAKLAEAEKLVGELSYYVISPLRLASDKAEEERRRGLYRAAAEWMEKGDE